MRAKPRQPQKVILFFSVDQQQVWSDVALAVAGPITVRGMVAESWLQNLSIRQIHQKLCWKNWDSRIPALESRNPNPNIEPFNC
jgi:hypothetical protein